MDERYLLYIDVLGFKDLVLNSPERVDDLFEIVASLNLNRHGSFSAIAFSDTILVHNVDAPVSEEDHRYFVMYQCEFFKELLSRTAGRGISFRGLLTYGPFEHYRLNDVPFFYGDALIRAYLAEKELQITGLVMDHHCRRHSHIFSSRPLNQDWNYVFVTQALDQWEDRYGGMRPIPAVIVDDMELGWLLGPELETLARCAQQSVNHPDDRVRAKYTATLDQYRQRYPRVFSALEPVGFAMEEASDQFDWSAVRERLKESYKWGSVRTAPKRGR